MRRSLLCAGLLIWAAPGLWAQDPPRAEIFGGYSYLHVPSPGGTSPSGNGWDFSLAGNLNRWFGVVTDVSNHYGTQALSLHKSGLTLLFGPRFSYRTLPRITPFAHILVGTVHGTQQLPVPLAPPCPPPLKAAARPCGGVTVSENALGVALGAGLDVRATRHIALRVVQADYLRANFTSDHQNDTRIAFGVVFRFP